MLAFYRVHEWLKQLGGMYPVQCISCGYDPSLLYLEHCTGDRSLSCHSTFHDLDRRHTVIGCSMHGFGWKRRCNALTRV